MSKSTTRRAGRRPTAAHLVGPSRHRATPALLPRARGRTTTSCAAAFAALIALIVFGLQPGLQRQLDSQLAIAIKLDDSIEVGRLITIGANVNGMYTKLTPKGVFASMQQGRLPLPPVQGPTVLTREAIIETLTGRVGKSQYYKDERVPMLFVAVDNALDLPNDGMLATKSDSVFLALLSGGADPNASDELGFTPLLLAIAQGQMSVAAMLLDFDADPLAKLNEGSSALKLAATYDNASIVRRLIRLGCDVNEPDRDGCTPIMTAASACSYHTLRALLDSGANPAAADKRGRTVLMYAYQGADADVIRAIRASVRAVHKRARGDSGAGHPIVSARRPSVNNGCLTGENAAGAPLTNVFDNENRLIVTEFSDGTISSYTYAGDGLRRSFNEKNAGVVTAIWDGDDVLQERS